MRHTALWFLKSQINDFSDIAWTVHSKQELEVAVTAAAAAAAAAVAT